MTAIKKLIDGNGNQYFPQTHTNAVVDDNGYSVESRMQAVQDVVNQAQMAIGTVPNDLAPTENSTNWVTSGGVYNSLTKINERTMVQKEITLTLKNGWAASTTWTKNNYYNKHAVIPVSSIGDGISIKAHTTNGGRYGFLSSYPSTIENGDTVVWCSGTGRNNIAAGETVTVMKTDFPEDCQYVYIGIANQASASATDNNYLPQAVYSISYCKTDILDIKSEIATIEEKITLLDTSTNVIDGKTAEKGWPGTNGWVSNSNNWKGYFITVRAGEMYRITANASNTTKIAMLRNSSHANGAAVNALETYDIAAGQYQDVTVPSGATCMWVDALAGSGITTTPQSIYSYYGEILDVVISHNNRIGELEDEVGESDIITIPVTSYNSGYYIQADSTNADFGKAIAESNTDYAVSPFINVKGYNSFSVNTLTSGRQYAGTVVYNAAKEPIVGYYYYSGTSGSYIATGELPSNAEYIRISHWTNNFSAGNVKLHLYDTLKDFTVRKITEAENRISALESSGSIPSGLTTYDYIGEKISFAIHQFTGNRYMTLSPSAYTVQGGAVFGDYYMVGFSNHAYLDVYNLATKTKLAGITLETPSISNAHANTIFFSNQYHTDGDEFPILYMCSGYNSDGYSKVYGYRVVNDNGSWSATIVHTITINSEGKWTEMVVDNVRQKAWIKKEMSGMKLWYCVDMPQYINGDATIDLSVLEPNFIAPSYESSGQCHLFFNDRIFFISGIPADNVSKLYVLNTLTGKYESIVNLIPVFGTDEPENIIIYNGYLHVGYRQSLGRLYFD